MTMNKCLMCAFLMFISAHSWGQGFPLSIPNYLDPTNESFGDFNWLGADYTQRLDNDALYGKTDRFYSNGLQFELTSLSDELYTFKENSHDLVGLGCNAQGKEPGTLKDCKGLLEALSPSGGTKKAKEKEDIFFLSRGFFFSHQMFTPTDIRKPASEASSYDRPYVGWARVGIMAGVSNPEYSDYSSLSIGCLGECARADDAQKWAHEDLSPSSRTPRGWDTQVKNTIAIQFTRTRTFKSYDVSDVFFVHRYLSADVGSVMNKFGGGISFLWAPFNALNYSGCDHAPNNRLAGTFGSSKSIEATTSKASNINFSICNEPITGPYLFADSHSQIVITNSLITSGVHTDTATYYHEAAPFVLTNKLGGGWRFGHGILLEFAVHYSSPETTEKGFSMNDHEWGQFTFSIPNYGLLSAMASVGFFGAIVESKKEDFDRQ